MIFFTAHSLLAASLLITIQTLFNCRLHITLFENNTISDSKVKWSSLQANQRPHYLLNLRWAVLKQFGAVWFADAAIVSREGQKEISRWQALRGQPPEQE